MTPTEIVDAITDCLESHDLDGLAYDDPYEPCRCELGDLMPCGVVENLLNCEMYRKVKEERQTK